MKRKILMEERKGGTMKGRKGREKGNEEKGILLVSENEYVY